MENIAEYLKSSIQGKEDKPTSAKPVSVPMPSLSAFNGYKKAKPNNYTEELDPLLLEETATTPEIVKEVSELHKVSPGKRARIGAKIGTSVGLSKGDPIQALMGAAIGSAVARGAGVVQSGEVARGKQRESITKTLSDLGVVDTDGVVGFSNGVGFDFKRAGKLRNYNSEVAGSRERSPYDVDISNPYSTSATRVARPLAQYVARGLMGKVGGTNNRLDTDAVNDLTGLFSNIFSEDTVDEGSIYQRAREIKDMMGVSSSKLSEFVSTLKGSVDADEFDEMLKGLRVLSDAE